MKKLLALTLAVMMIATLAACGNSGDKDASSTAPASDAAPADTASAGSDAAPADSSDTIKVGVLAPLTGEVSVYGIAVKNGVQMAVDEINANGGILGKQIELMAEDEKGDPTEALNAYNKLMDNGMVYLIGDVTSKPCEAVAQSAANDGIPMLTPTGTAASLTTHGDNIFRTCFLDPFQGKIMAAFADEKLGAETVAVMYDSSNDYSQGIAEAFKAEAEARGMTVVADEAYGADDKDYKTQLTKINAAAPDALMLPDYYEKIALIANQARQVGYQGVMLGADGWDGVLGKLTDETKSAVDNCYFSNHYFVDDQGEKVATFVNAFKEKYNGEAPVSFAALGYDSVYIMKQAIEAAGSTDSAAIVEAMKAVDYDGVTGHMTFDENGDPVKSVAIIKLQDGAMSLETMMDA